MSLWSALISKASPTPSRRWPPALRCTRWWRRTAETYTTDVTKFFTDADGDTLTYYVSVNGGEFTKLEKPEAYTYTYGENFVNARLTFKANDGKADSLQNCTVILNNPEYPVVNGADSSTTDTTTGTAVQLSIGSLIKHPQSIGLNYFVSIDGGEYKQVTLSSNKYTYAPTKGWDAYSCSQGQHRENP